MDLDSILNSYKVNGILVVTGGMSFETCGAKAILKKCLSKYKVTYFSDFEVNPRLIDAIKGAYLAIKENINLIIGIGGGSVLDMAKLVKAIYLSPDDAENIARGLSKVIDPQIPLIAIPTTAGSGSEATHFAVTYIGDEKYSVTDNALLPNVVILDSKLLHSASKYQKACNVLDAISQSIESAWAIDSTDESRQLSFQALTLCINNFVEYVNSKNNHIAAEAMITASNLAGQAINISKTTAAHSWSYGFTKKIGIPHGHAVWFTLPEIFEIHARLDSYAIRDPRGPKHLAKVIEKLTKILKKPLKQDFLVFFKNMLNSISISADIESDFKISKEKRLYLSKNINQERMKNNPIIFNQFDINKIFKLI